MRGADGGPWRRLCALPALWTGLFYDSAALDAAFDLVADWTAAEREQLRADMPRLGLRARFRSGTVREIAAQVVDLARAGLQRRHRLDSTGQDESHYLTPLADIAASGRTPAEQLLDDYATRWGGRIDPVFIQEAY